MRLQIGCVWVCLALGAGCDDGADGGSGAAGAGAAGGSGAGAGAAGGSGASGTGGAGAAGGSGGGEAGDRDAGGRDDATAARDDAQAPDAGPPRIPLDHPVPAACWDDLAAGEAVVFAEGLAPGTEGIAFGGDGALYASSPRDGRIWRIGPDGAAAPFAEIAHAAGLAATADGALLVADLGASNDPGVRDGALWRLTAEGTATRLNAEIDSPNFVVALPEGGALVSDDFDTRVWHVDAAGMARAVIADVPSPNGLAFGPGRAAFYVASTFTQLGEVTRFGVGPGGLPDPQVREVLHEFGPGQTLDGLAVDAHDQVYVAANVRGNIWRLRGDGTGEPVLVAQRLRTPASLAFGVAPDFDPCSLYVTELVGPRIWRVAVGALGLPLP